MLRAGVEAAAAVLGAEGGAVLLRSQGCAALVGVGLAMGRKAELVRRMSSQRPSRKTCASVQHVFLSLSLFWSHWGTPGLQISAH